VLFTTTRGKQMEGKLTCGKMASMYSSHASHLIWGQTMGRQTVATAQQTANSRKLALHFCQR